MQTAVLAVCGFSLSRRTRRGPSRQAGRRSALRLLKADFFLMPDEVLIIGGGFAGLSAGVALAQSGWRVRLLEQKAYLGGRARSFYYAPMKTVVDNGQHVFMGCYHATIDFLRTIGSLDRVRFQPRLKVHFIGKEEGVTSLVFPSVPAPFHLALGTLVSGSLSLREKIQVLRLGSALRHADSGAGVEDFGSLTVDAWLARLGQSEKLRRDFWNLLCIAALNEDPHIAAATMFEPVLRLALFQSPRDSCIGLASNGLSECYTEAAADFIRNRQGQVELNRNVTGILISEARAGAGAACQGVQIADGTVVHARTVLSAVPSFQLVRLLPPDLLNDRALFAAFTALRPAPIISLNLWFDRAVTDLEFVGLRDTNIQWLFNKGKLLGSGQHYVSLVISGAHEHIHKDKIELVELAHRELKDLFPTAREARLLHSLAIKERFATFSPDIHSAAFRPPARTPVRGLFLAGDWTQTGLPATIESAVKSGYTAASEICKA